MSGKYHGKKPTNSLIDLVMSDYDMLKMYEWEAEHGPNRHRRRTAAAIVRRVEKRAKKRG